MKGFRIALDPDSPGEDVQLWQPECLPTLNVMLAHRCRRRWRMLHETYAICHVPIPGNPAAGYSHWWYRGREHDCTPGGTIVVEPGEVHAVKRLRQPAVFYWAMYIPVSLMQSAAEETGVPSPPHLSVAQSESARVYVACEQLFRSMVQDETCLEQETRLAAFARVLLEDCGERPPTMTNRMVVPAVRRARDYLRAHYAEPIRLEELATVAGVSRFHLAHLFTRAIGFSPHTYQNHLRVAEARRQLRSGVHPAHVDVGFTDQSHLGRHFKRIVGITPGEYAARAGVLPPAPA